MMKKKRENCNMLQFSLVKRDKSTRNTREKRDKGKNSLEKVAHGDKKSLEKGEEVREWSKKQLLKNQYNYRQQ